MGCAEFPVSDKESESNFTPRSSLGSCTSQLVTGEKRCVSPLSDACNDVPRGAHTHNLQQLFVCSADTEGSSLFHKSCRLIGFVSKPHKDGHGPSTIMV